MRILRLVRAHLSSLAFDTAQDVDEANSESSSTALAKGKERDWWSAPSHLSFEMSCSFTIQVLAQRVLLRNFAFLHSVTGSLCFLRWSVLASSRLLNLSCTTDHTSFGMSCSFTVQVLSQLDLLKKVTRIKSYKNVFQLLPKELDAGALDGEELLVVELEVEVTSPSCKSVASKSAGSTASPTPPFRRVRLRQQRHRS